MTWLISLAGEFWPALVGLVGGAFGLWVIKDRRAQQRAAQREQELADAQAQLDMAESRERVRRPAVVHELRKRHTRPE
jgi:hypothetical protein